MTECRRKVGNRRTCQNCKNLIYPTMIGYACKKRHLWGTDIPLFFDGYECKKWKPTNRKDDVNGFVPIKGSEPGAFRILF